MTDHCEKDGEALDPLRVVLLLLLRCNKLKLKIEITKLKLRLKKMIKIEIAPPPSLPQIEIKNLKLKNNDCN